MTRHPLSAESQAFLTHMGAAIRRLRVNRNLTLSLLSTLSGISLGFLSQIERGTSYPSFESALSIAEAFNIPLSHLFALVEVQAQVEELEKKAVAGIEAIKSPAEIPL